MVEEIDLDKYLEGSVSRKYEIEGVLEDIHGEHAKRTQLITELVFEATDQLTEEEKEKVEKRSRSRERPESVHTFPKDKDGNLLVPLGGKHGYIYGALRTAMLDLYKDKLQNKKWKGYGLGTYINQACFISPEWVKVGKKFSNPENEPKSYMVETAGMSHGVITIYYDYVEKAPFKLTIEVTNEKVPEELFLSMLAHCQRLGCGPKGRGRITFQRVTRTK